jgi:L-alanine-DL-glutamate epimerase-like enolase superfamily enzyme
MTMTKPAETPRVSLTTRRASLPMKVPFHFAGNTFSTIPVLHVELAADGHVGRGEGAGVYYTADTPDGMRENVERVRLEIERGLTRQELRRLLPSGGARHAVDSALWELEARRQGCAAWQLAGLPSVRPLRTTLTLGADAPEAMARQARTDMGEAPSLKLKLTGDAALDVARVAAVRAARPDAWMSVDANQAYVVASIGPLLDALVRHDVAMLEQPFARGREEDMRRIQFPLPTAADESCLDLSELEQVADHFDGINIKLDKCGGLTEGLLMCRRARALGLDVMVGNMGGSSLAMGPAFILGQLCDVVDLDGPFFLSQDVVPGMQYVRGHLIDPGGVWGGDPSAADDVHPGTLGAGLAA